MHNAQHRPPTSLLHIMDRRLSRYGEDYYLVDWFTELPERFELIPCYDEYFTSRYLDNLMQDDFNHATMRAIAYERQPPLEPLNNDQLVRVVARRLVGGSLRLALAPPLSFGGLGDDETPDQAPAPVTVQTKAMFSLHLVDDATDDPIAGAKLTVKLPGSTERTCPTDAAGRIDLATIKGGTVDVSTAIDRATIARALVFVRLGALSSSQPTTAAADQDTAGWPVIQLVEHRVKSGETLDGIARRYNLSANALMQFNWQTNDPDEVDRRLLLEVGCQKRGADQHVVFDDADQPGIVYCPAALRLRGLALDTLHIVRVKRLVRKKVYQYSV